MPRVPNWMPPDDCFTIHASARLPDAGSRLPEGRECLGVVVLLVEGSAELSGHSQVSVDSFIR